MASRQPNLVSESDPFFTKSDIKPEINADSLATLRLYVMSLEHKLISNEFLNPSVRSNFKKEINKVREYLTIATLKYYS